MNPDVATTSNSAVNQRMEKELPQPKPMHKAASVQAIDDSRASNYIFRDLVGKG